MKLISVLLALSLFFVISCASTPVKEADLWVWLNTISGGVPPEIDITGKWRDSARIGFTGWGDGFLKQDQNKVTGTIGDYEVKGLVSGKKVYLVLLSRDHIYYTARLEQPQKSAKDELVGSYFIGKDMEQVKSYPIAFINFGTYVKIYPKLNEEHFVNVGVTMMEKESCEEYRSSTGGHHTCMSHELIYLGRVGDSIRIGYREFMRDTGESGGTLARPAYSMEATYPTRSKLISFRNIRIEIIEISDDGLKYKLISAE